VSNNVSTTSYTAYDGLGRVTAGNQNTSGGATYSFGYVYNALGLASMTYPSGRIVAYHYDGAGRLDKAGLNTVGATDYVSSVSYHPHGAPSVTILGNAVVETAIYNSRLQPRLLEAAKTTSLWKQENFFCPSEQLDCTSNNGNVVSQKLTAGATLVLATGYGYDGVNRITWASETGAGTPWAQGYGYTADGSTGRFGNLNIAGDGDASDLRCSVYDPATNRCNASGFVYDNGIPNGVGNLTSYAGRTLTYDAENRQKTLVDGSTTWTYSYDGEGRRVKKTNGATTTVYVYDAMGKLAAEYASAAPADQPDCARCFLTADHLGSTRLVTDGVTGQVKRRTDYHPFGWEINPGYGDRNSVAGYSATDKFNPKFTGHPRDYESGLGLDYFGARYYSGAQGRFTTADWSAQPQPIPYADLTDPQTLNLYSYVRNNPLGRIDPDGHDDRPCPAGQPGCINGEQRTTEGAPLAPSPRNRAAADRNPAVLTVTRSSGERTEGEIEYQLKTPSDDKQDYRIVQGETNRDRTPGKSSFGPGTSAPKEANGFTDTIRAGILQPASNSVQTFYMVPVDSSGKPVGAPQPVNVRDLEGSVFNARGVYFANDRGAFVNGRRVDSPTFVPPRRTR
jgi:RHS repeat-associated protein